jgi:hypothetical protein
MYCKCSSCNEPVIAAVDCMHDEDIFEAEEVMDEGNIYE